MKIIHLPLEYVATRYTADWELQFENEFRNREVAYVTISPVTTCFNVTVGSVLDAFETSRYKLAQLKILVDMIEDGSIEDGDVLLFADLWFPGLETLFYLRNLTGINFKISGVLHAGTWDPYDFTCRNNMREWAQHLETSWLNEVDIIFVATQWHKDLIVMNSGSFSHSKIYVTGLPFYSNQLTENYKPVEYSKRNNLVVFPHRLESEKQPEKFDKLKRKFSGVYTFIKTLEATKSRKEYFNLLASSKVMISYAQQETFGYSTLEAMTLGNFVIVPNDLSYKEIVPEEFRYNKESEIPEMLKDFMSRTEGPVYPGLDKYVNAINNMLRIIKFELKKGVEE